MNFYRYFVFSSVFIFSVFAGAQSDYKTARVKCSESSKGGAARGGGGSGSSGSGGSGGGSGSGQCTPDFGLSGSSEIMTHFTYRGLNYSDTQPSFISSFLYNFGSQFRLGAWGASLKLPDSSLWLKFVMEIQLKFAEQHDVTLFIHKDQFYSNSERNGIEAGLNYYFLDRFYVGLSTKDNFEATQTSSEYFSFAQIFPIANALNFSYKIGYTNQRSQNYDNYLDAKVSISYELKNSTIEFGVTDMSSKETFNQKAEPHFYGSLLAYY